MIECCLAGVSRRFLLLSSMALACLVGAAGPLGGARLLLAAEASRGSDAKPAKPLTNKLHTWTDQSGKFSLEAVLLDVRDGKARLKRKDGTTVDVPLEKLSKDDREIAETLASQRGTPMQGMPVLRGFPPGFDKLVAALRAFQSTPTEQDFRTIDAWQAMYRKDRPALTNGDIPLDLIYESLSSPLDGSEKGWRKHFSHIEQWRKAMPKSPTPCVVEGYSYVAYAWVARGNGMASTVSEDQFRSFRERLERARASLEEAGKLSNDDPAVYKELITVAKGLSADRAEVDALFQKATAIDAKFFPLYETMADYLLPRWHGRPGEVYAFAAAAADKVGGDAGLDIYGRIAFSVSLSEGGTEGFSVDRLQKATQYLLKRYPHSASYASFACRVAFETGDRETAARLVKQIGDPPNRSIWPDRAEFERMKDWLNGKPAKKEAK